MLSNDEKIHFWCVVQTQVNAEFKAALNIENQGYEVFFPKYQKTISHARKKTLVTRALFPRYIFVKVDLSKHQWRSIRSTIGVSTMVQTGDLPSRMPARVIDKLKERTDEDGYYLFKKPNALKAGDVVKIIDGAFEQSLGLVESVKDEHRVILLLTLLKREVRVNVDSNQLEKVNVIPVHINH